MAEAKIVNLDSSGMRATYVHRALRSVLWKRSFNKIYSLGLFYSTQYRGE